MAMAEINESDTAAAAALTKNNNDSKQIVETTRDLSSEKSSSTEGNENHVPDMNQTNSRQSTETMPQSAAEEINEAKTPDRFPCLLCRKTLKTKKGLIQHMQAKHGPPKNKYRKRKHSTHVSSSTTTIHHVSNMHMSGGEAISSLVMERAESLSSSSSSARSKPTESQKKQKVSTLLELLKQKAKQPPVKFVVDVDNVGAIENILKFFQDRDVHVTFYVKNQLHLQLPPSCIIPYEIALVESSDDDDMAALMEAINLDCFIVTCDKFDSYLKSGLIDKHWLDAHRIPCIWKKGFEADKSSSHISLSLPLNMIPRMNNLN